MKKYKLYISIFSLMGIFLMGGFFNTPTATSAEHMTEFPTMECDNPTKTYLVGVTPGEHSFNVSKLELPKATCIKMTFENPDDEDHDFTIEDSAGEEWVHMDARNWAFDEGLNSSAGTYLFGYPENKTTMEEQGQGVATHFYMTPDEDVTLSAYCEVPGHQDDGMEFDVVVGDGSPAKASPGFELPIFLFSLILVATVTIKKRRN